MILFEDALDLVLKHYRSTEKECVGFLDSAGRILAEDVFSDIDMPPFNKSAMDGFACRMIDIHNDLEIVETIAAGKFPEKSVGLNQCSRIMTGAKIPDGADCVLMVEHIENIEDNKIRFLKQSTNPNICYQAEDIKKGDIVLRKGTKIKPQHIAVMASVGCTKPMVAKKPVIGILSTGNEIVEPENVPGLSQIRNSNGYQLITQVERAGAIPYYQGIVRDSEEDTYMALTKAIENSDIVLLTGGVSMGDFDFVPEIMIKAGVDIKFEAVAVQPGKPTTFGVHHKALVFGLPGNPVSSYIQFELLVRPLILKMMGASSLYQTVKLPMDEDYTRRKSERLSWFPVIITDEGTVKPADYHGSAHIYSLPAADGITSIAIGKDIIKKGELVDVRQI
jgi:molybdopterin molybdotransferase